MSSRFWFYVQAIVFLTIVLGMFIATIHWIDRKLDERYGFNTVLVYEPCEDTDPSDEEVEHWIKTQDLFKARAIQLEMKKKREKIS